MFTVKKGTEFINDVRALDESLKNIRISSIQVNKADLSVEYNFICDETVSAELKEKILREAEKITSKTFRGVTVTIKKIVSNDQLVNNEIYNYLSKSYPSISIFLKDTDVRSTVFGNLVKYVVRLTQDGAEYVSKNGVLNKMNEFLKTRFCSDFAGTVEIKQAEENVSLLSEQVYLDHLEKIEHRTIKVEDVVAIDDIRMGNIATYIEDVTSGDVIVCGTITDVAERMTKTGKPFFVFHIDDTTGKTSGVYFTKKATYPKIKNLKVGDCIIARGNLGEYNGRKSFTFEKINYCVFPKDFVKKDKYKKTAPAEYKTVFPEKAETIKIASVFDSDLLPEVLTQKEYVVFDLETTGLDVMNNGITEIGAVKIKNGRVSEQFTTLVKPDYPITEEITKITGITEEMVAKSPRITAVIGDFMKFIQNTTLVAHNADFDMKFIKRFAGAEDYEVKNPVLDTLELARAQLPFLRRHDLHTLADHFGIVFRHHRALSDSLATAEIFIELMKEKSKKDAQK